MFHGFARLKHLWLPLPVVVFPDDLLAPQAYACTPDVECYAAHLLAHSNQWQKEGWLGFFGPWLSDVRWRGTWPRKRWCLRNLRTEAACSASALRRRRAGAGRGAGCRTGWLDGGRLRTGYWRSRADGPAIGCHCQTPTRRQASRGWGEIHSTSRPHDNWTFTPTSAGRGSVPMTQSLLNISWCTWARGGR